MIFRIRRRRFGHLAIASSIATLFANLTGKTLAQQNKIDKIYGFKVKQSSNQLLDLENSTPNLVFTSSNLINNLINNLTNSIIEIPSTLVENSYKPSESKNKALSLSPRERITGCTTLPDGTLIVSSVSSSKRGDVTRLMLFNSKSSNKHQLKKALKITKFKNQNDVVESLVATKDGKLIGAISSAGVPPFELATIDYLTGEIISGINPFKNTNDSSLPEILPGDRVANLAVASDGTIYATRISAENLVRLVKIDLVNKSLITGRGKIINLVELTFDDQPLINDVLSLAFAASGKLYALANFDYEEVNSLYTVDIKTGKMQFVRKLDVDKFAFMP